MNSQLVSLDERAGTNVSSYTSIDDVLEASGLNFNVETVPAHDPEGQPVNGVNLIRREDNGDLLGTCGSRYNVIQNRAMFEPYARVVEDNGAKYESAGNIRGGKINWISAKLPTELNVQTASGLDKFEQRLVMLVYHDGKRRNSYLSYNNRVVCNNMLTSLQKSSRLGMGIRHTPRWDIQLEEAESAFAQSVASMATFRDEANNLAKIKMTEDQALMFSHRFVGKWIDDEVRDKNDKWRTDRSKTIELTKVETLMNLFKEGIGNFGQTRYDMLNAVTEYLDHRSVKVNTNLGTRLLSNFSGTQRNLKLAALNELQKTSGYLRKHIRIGQVYNKVS
tara:strand:- start:118 stop:1122 length:1005 start_codon:yes stop_codon:yes gene_type:complete